MVQHQPECIHQLKVKPDTNDPYTQTEKDHFSIQHMSYNWSNRTILITEDDEMNYRYLDLIFSRFTNINVIWAINGQMAVDYCQIYQYIDIVIMDLQLPVLDGVEAIRQIKSFKPSLPIIAHTANTNSDDIQQCMAAGCDDFITKPVSIQDLLSRIENLLNPVATS